MKRSITINGRELPVHFGMRAINEFSRLTNRQFDDTINGAGLGNLESVVQLAVFGLNDGARREGSSERYTENDVWDMADDDPTVIVRFSEIFMESVQPLMEKLGAKAEDFPTPTQTPPQA